MVQRLSNSAGKSLNVTNLVSFDAQSRLLSDSLGLGSGGSFGNHSRLLNNPRSAHTAVRFRINSPAPTRVRIAK